jgi:outer membrane protein assembly factor BamD (BamD/ComL family)
MKDGKNMKKVLLFMMLVVLLLTSCHSLKKDLENPDLTPEEFFQKAQEAVIDWNRYKLAIQFYEEFMRRYPDMKNKIIEAEYEIAFIKFKQRKLDEAEERFNQILDKYNTDEAVYYPSWPALMSNKGLENIAEEREKGGFWKRLFNKKTRKEKEAEEEFKQKRREAKAKAKLEKEQRKAAKKAAKKKRETEE